MDNPTTNIRAKTKQSRRSASTESTVDDVEAVTFGDFRLLRKLGQGGMGEVHLAEQISLKRKVAIKMLRGDVVANPSALARFQEESTIIAKLSHANVVQAYMVGEHEGRRYLVMEYVEGISLSEYMVRKGPMEAPLVLSILRQVANALQRASEQGIIHRDIKPGNILLTRKGEAKVADFGLSRCLGAEERVDLTRAGAAVGTPMYMSPEQIEGKDLDCRSDIYSLGVTCYQMLAGQPPFEGSNAFVIASKHVREEPVALETIRADLPPGLCDIVRKMMAKKPSARYTSARDLLQDISRVRHSLGGTTQTVAIAVDTTPIEALAPPVVPLWKRPIWLLAAAGAFVALGVFGLLVLGAAFAWFHHADPVAVPEFRAATPDLRDAPKPADVPADDTAALKITVEQYLKGSTPSPGAVEACIDLAVLYLEQKKTVEAEALFRRMDDRRFSPSCHFVGRLGLAVIDALNNKDKASRGKFTELFDAKAKDNRVAILNDYLTKKPDFAVWVNEADSHNVRAGVAESSLPKGFRRPPIGTKFPFRK